MLTTQTMTDKEKIEALIKCLRYLKKFVGMFAKGEIDRVIEEVEK